jgi:hypothetical protein
LFANKKHKRTSRTRQDLEREGKSRTGKIMHDQPVWRDYTVEFTESKDSLDLTGPRIRRDYAVTRGLTGLQMIKRTYGILQTKRTKGIKQV